ncbi:MAG TPA: DUF3368 domain-containing protein [Gemmataceae bacterium]|nr:DUF3368 domain-containing protein [Gemmataceae bacterium]
MLAPAVVDASPLIVLAKASHLVLLQLASDPVLVPQRVALEIQGQAPNDPAAQALAKTSWLVIVDPGPILPALQPYRLGPGEAEVLTWALTHPGTQAILDERVARRCATALGVSHQGTVGVVIAARQHGVIPAARPVLEQLRRAGLYLSDRAMQQALALVGE